MAVIAVAVLTAVVAVWAFALRPSSGNTEARAGDPSAGTAAPREPSSTSRAANTPTTHLQLTHRDYAVGDCVVWDDSKPGQIGTRVVPCTQPHLVQIVGTIDLRARFHRYPTENELRTLFQTECVDDAKARLGAGVATTQNRAFGGLYPSAASYRRGDSIVSCWIGTVNGSTQRLALVTGRLG
jgi:hypothetical protein